MKNTLKIILAILLLICLFDMPYGYYQFVRFVAFAVFGYFAFVEFQANKKEIAFVYGALALLFQPFLKIALGRTMWNVVDLIVAGALVLSVFIHKKSINE